MNRTELIKDMKEACTEEVSQKQVNAVLTALETVVRNVVAKNGEVTIPGICTVKSKAVKAKEGTISFGTHKGEAWSKPEHREATVRIVKSLKNVFNEPSAFRRGL